MNITVICATSKPMPALPDAMYLPLHVGKNGQEGFGLKGDDTGDNISDKNYLYSELTGLYWAWKNIDADAIGLVHYRRYLTARSRLGYRLRGKWNSLLTAQQAERALRHADVVLPRKRWYIIETSYSHLANYLPECVPAFARDYVKSLSPQYAQAWDQAMNRRWQHNCNMFIMKKEVFDGYCTWLFDVLAHVEQQLDVQFYQRIKLRVMGYVSECLLDVWLTANGIRYVEKNRMFMEKRNNLGRIRYFLRRKFHGFCKKCKS
ncbi:MAG: DUF4422 domain-containing protein [Oscillospiraceae bacterium]|jgi:hypothetical protein|nr:DUF4422 domain-containing protein [Oscillospiraceae bacterium]